MADKSKYLKGQLLLDSGELAGSFFARTVVLICQHDSEGAFGLVLNRPANKKLGEVIDAELPEALRGQPLYVGGPVQPTTLSYLHSDTDGTENEIMDRLTMGHSLYDLLVLGGDLKGERRVKAFAGYAGWAPGQLEGEMRRKAWIVQPARLDLIFDVEPDNLWRKILRSAGGWKNHLLAEMPEDPSVN